MTRGPGGSVGSGGPGSAPRLGLSWPVRPRGGEVQPQQVAALRHQALSLTSPRASSFLKTHPPSPARAFGGRQAGVG